MGDLIAPTHLLVLLIVVLLVFGPKKLPELGRSLGETIKEFRRATRQAAEDDEKERDDRRG